MKYVEGVKDDNGRQWGSDVLSEKPIRSLNYTKTIGNWEEKNTILKRLNRLEHLV